MKRLLLINASPQGQASHAWRLAQELAMDVRLRCNDMQCIERDLGAQPLPPIGPEYARALTQPTPFEAAEFAVSEALIGELEEADAVLIATPMHNFTVPAALKLWIDYVLRIQRTFTSDANGKTGLLADRPVYVLVASGGYHQGARARQADFLTPYLRHVLNTLGLFSVHFTYLEGLVFGADAVASALSQARAKLALEPLFNPAAPSTGVSS